MSWRNVPDTRRLRPSMMQCGAGCHPARGLLTRADFARNPEIVLVDFRLRLRYSSEVLMYQ
jgi:hypothetical protein